MLAHLTNKPLTKTEVRRELLPIYSEFQIQEAILGLIEKGLIEIIYPCGSELGFRITKPKGPPSS